MRPPFHHPAIGTCGRGIRRARGFSLIELMVALVLGLVVIGAAVGVFLSNKQSYRTNYALGQVQEASRIAFELLARDLRQAGLTGCGNTTRVANTLNNQATTWWANFGNAIRGYDGNQDDPAVVEGTGTAQRVVGTDSIQLIGAGESGLSVQSHNPTAANFKLNEPSADLQDGDIIIVCDPDHAAITQVTNYNSSNVTLVHNTGTASPGNCSKGLGFPTQCTVNGNPYTFGANSQIAKLSAADWYIGNNPMGGRSLYRLALGTNSGAAVTTAMEMVRDVTDLQLEYLTQGGIDYVPASAITDWRQVIAVRIILTAQGSEAFTGTDGQPIRRSFTTIVTLRNRVS
ncbi:type IV pilus assembly protein PilW [Fontimonas thermophila]|uniref:Type IV pilus assembly protein PilW n=1 Tax=Fontimonas thermophila TaxID=1076937 RepID=A0A1I2KM77_9GAMM|nr:PilW family protein [Fontimonas thermophila]SFF66036.1 type IV pilus assembly protein PilW [Fontimonas thermophila]